MSLSPPQIIGRGTWLDKVAAQILEREASLGRQHGNLRVESGLGASGVPHIGNYSDAARAWGVSLALKTVGKESELIMFSDDKDGLRKVPAGFPKELSKYIGFPVSNIPDPFGCHDSYGRHMSLLLMSALDETGIKYRGVFGSEAYRDGLLNKQIDMILRNAKTFGIINKEILGQEKYTETLPYFPVCENCGRIYTTKATEYVLEKHVVKYHCDGMELHGQTLKGCGYHGEMDVFAGNGKLSWKAEFAARWSALKINAEGYGKELTDSVKVNDRVMREILHEEPPYHWRWEHFIDKTGAKLSKSTGNIIAPQLWLRYASVQTLFLLMYKRTVGSRAIWIKDVPVYIAEFDELEDHYFGRKKSTDLKEQARLRGLYEYCWNLKPPNKPTLHVPHNLLVYLFKVAPKDGSAEFVLGKLAIYGYKIDPADGRFNERLTHAENWAKEIDTITESRVELTGNEREAVLELAAIVNASNDENYLQNVIFTIAKKHDVPTGRFFKVLYRILIGADSGPKLGPYIIAMGAANVSAALGKSARNVEESGNGNI